MLRIPRPGSTGADAMTHCRDHVFRVALTPTGAARGPCRPSSSWATSEICGIMIQVRSLLHTGVPLVQNLVCPPSPHHQGARCNLPLSKKRLKFTGVGPEASS